MALDGRRLYAVARVLIVIAVLVFATGFFVWRLWFRDTTTPVSVDEAVERFQTEREDSGGDEPRAVGAPEPGVYVYETRGYEAVDALSGANHEYPPLSTITVERSECGATLRWQPLEERHQELSLCWRDGELVLVSYESFHRFFGQDTLLLYSCADPPALITTSDPGSRAYQCTTGNEIESLTVTDRGRVDVQVGSQVVEAVEIELVSELEALDDSVTGSKTEILRMAPDTGLLLTWEVINGSVADSIVGEVNFEESYTVSLRSLDPTK